MLSEPQSVTYSGTAHSLPATSRGPQSSTYKTSDGLIKMTTSQSGTAKRLRTLVRLDLTKTAADPLISAQNIVYGSAVYMVIDRPITGFSVAELVSLMSGLISNITDSSNANATKLIGGET